MQTDEAELRRQLAATAARASIPGFDATDVAVRVRRIRRCRAAVAATCGAAIVAAAVAVPVALGGTSGAAGIQAAPRGAPFPGPVASPLKLAPPPPWTVTVNGQPLGVPEELADGYTGQTQFDVAPGEKVTIEMTITVPAHTQMTKFFLGITGDTAGIGPRGPIGMEPVLATASNLAPGVHAFAVHWTAPVGAPPRYGYQVAMAMFWPRSVKSEPYAAEIPLVGVAVRPGSPVPGAAATRLRALALQAAKKDGDAKPQWMVAVRTTFARAMAAAGLGGSGPGVSPGTPVYLVVAKGSFTADSNPAGSSGTGYLSAIIDARTFSSYAMHLSGLGSAAALSTLGPRADLTGGQPARQQ
jgi:hypothetical protein